MQNVLNWFEIPVRDLSRAVRFYEEALATKLKTETFQGSDMAVFPADGVNGALVAGPQRKSTTEGSIVYLHVGQGGTALDQAIERVQFAGGGVLVPVTDIGPMGQFAVIRDSEGNAVGLHAPR